MLEVLYDSISIMLIRSQKMSLASLWVKAVDSAWQNSSGAHLEVGPDRSSMLKAPRMFFILQRESGKFVFDVDARFPGSRR